MHRGMLTDTATSERPGPWSEPVLLENVEWPSAVEQGGFKAAIARWRDMASPAADFVAVRMRIMTFRAVASYRRRQQLFKPLGLLCLAPLESWLSLLQSGVLDFEQGLGQYDLTSAVPEKQSTTVFQ